MDTSGRVTSLQSKHSRVDRVLKLLLVMTFITLGACATSMQFGKEPMIERLGQLTIDKSTTAQIETVLGEPQGRGEVSSPSFGTKEAWLYEVTKADGATARMQMLMVFIDNERRVYHGHLWFASGSLYSQTD